MQVMKVFYPFLNHAHIFYLFFLLRLKTIYGNLIKAIDLAIDHLKQWQLSINQTSDSSDSSSKTYGGT